MSASSQFLFLVSSFRFLVSGFSFGFRFLVFDDECDGFAELQFSDSALRPRPVTVFAEVRFFFFILLRANQNVRAKERLVNSVFLVQLRKMVATEFRGLARIKNPSRDMAVSRLEGLSSDCAGTLGEKFGRVGRLILHRGCTGNAERQWSVVSKSVVSGWWSVGFRLAFASVGRPRRPSPHELWLAQTRWV